MTKNFELIVPPNVKYISDWTDFSFSKLEGPCIIDKVIPGCGFTHYAIHCPEDMIICSPRKILLENKHQQDPNTTYLVVNTSESTLEVDKVFSAKTTSKGTKKKSGSSLKPDQLVLKNRDRIREELEEYIKFCSGVGIPIKILVTYDSFRIIREILEELKLMKQFSVFIDEFQSILSDANFKADVEIQFLEYLKNIERLYYVSATPMMDNYLDKIDNFKNLNYYKLDWETLQPGRLTKPDLQVKEVVKISQVIDRIINSYKSGNYVFSVSPITGQLVYSKEAIIYVNSVDMILSAIKRNNLTPTEVNILCADTVYNTDRINSIPSSLGQFEIGRVPLRDEPRKMFTFCTRTVYLGADFYSDNARSFVFSNANLDFLSIDISQDLPQILGRQRLLENPWKNSAEFYYTPLIPGSKNAIDRSVFTEQQKKKIRTTEEVIKSFETVKTEEAKDFIVNMIFNNFKVLGYSKSYISVITKNTRGVLEKVPAFNNLVMIAEQRAFDIQQVDYKDRFSVAATIVKNNLADPVINSKIYTDFQTRYAQATSFFNKAKLLCEDTDITDEIRDQFVKVDLSVTDLVYLSYTKLGPQRMATLMYNPTKIKKELNINTFNDSGLIDYMKSEFKPGELIPTSELKERVRKVYSTIGYQGCPKGTDILKYFEAEKTSTYIDDGTGKKKKSAAYRILKPLT